MLEYKHVEVHPYGAQYVTLHIKIGLKRIQNMLVWLRKMALAQHICRGF
jgi:hypothetical protein